MMVGLKLRCQHRPVRVQAGSFGIGFSAAIAAGLTASWFVGSFMTRGRETFVDPALPPSRDFDLESPDGITIAATFRPGRHSRSPSVLLLHGFRASRQATAANAMWLASLGYATLSIDLRGHGQSTIAPCTFGLKEAEEARIAFDWLKKRQGNAPVCIIGISLGGAACLIGDAGPIPADALVLQGVYSDIRHAIRNRIARYIPRIVATLLEPLLSFQTLLRLGVSPSRLAPVKALSQYDGPVLIIGGQQDRSTLATETRALYAAAKDGEKLMLSPDGDHIDICRLTSATYRDCVKAFLAQTIGSADIGN
ncbi:alpha/beta hydrolase [Asaia sp. As-1742]|uniref:alpha/beta hydrolase n=1 Tax=Asaia sp. As-1742 TaxID=2608325 RepID=UPI00141F5AF1|nr:alpha/beta fold hydrolase [Asaia sp. As-1742]